MATKGPKIGTPKGAVPKPAARVTTAPKTVAAKVEKPVPEATVQEPLVPFVAPEPVPAVEAVPQEVIVTATAAPVAKVAEQAVTIAPARIETVAPAAVKETPVMATVIENNTAKAQAFFTDLNDRAKTAVEKSTKLVEDANEFAKGNVEALVESGRIAAKGFEGLGQEAAEYGRRSFESATATLKTFATVKSPTELFQLQSDYLRTAFDSYVAEASKNTEALLKLASDAAQPISNRFAVAVEKVKTAA
jgi:phasin family protein